jgi:LacI family transcriptional regulator
MDPDDETPSHRPGIKDVAARAGVGIASVSRVLSGKPGSSAALVQRVLEAAHELGYQPNALAQGLRRGVTPAVMEAAPATRASRTIAFVGADLGDPGVAAMVDGAARALGAAGVPVLFGEPASIDRMPQPAAGAVIVWPGDEDDAVARAWLRDVPASMPTVLVDRSPASDRPAHAVQVDHHAGVLDAALRLLDLGHRRIGLVVGRDTRRSRECVRAVHEACESRGAFDGLVIARGTLAAAHGEASIEAWRSSGRSPTAVILGGHALLEGALRAVARHGLALGTDLSLVTCDDGPLARGHAPPIAVVARDLAGIGRRAAEIALRHLESTAPPETAWLPTWFEPRTSCGRAP